VVIFLKLSVGDLMTVRELLRLFGHASGLLVNYRKTSATLIRGGQRDGDLVAHILQCQLTEFSINYPRLQLAL
jgi:hypothetical protein